METTRTSETSASATQSTRRRIIGCKRLNQTLQNIATGNEGTNLPLKNTEFVIGHNEVKRHSAVAHKMYERKIREIRALKYVVVPVKFKRALCYLLLLLPLPLV
jgi:hypothetical protein